VIDITSLLEQAEAIKDNADEVLSLFADVELAEAV
jgi:hypothetical protein